MKTVILAVAIITCWSLVMGIVGTAGAESAVVRERREIGALGGGSLSGGNSLDNPGIDVWNPKCSSATTIRARVMADDPTIGGGPAGSEITPETLHVTVLCVMPLARRGKGDKEIAQLPERRVSQWAEAGSCQEAFIEVGCDHNAPCSGNYGIEYECVNRNFLPNWYIPTLNR